MVYYSALHYAAKAEKSALSAATYAANLKNATFGNIGDIKYSCRNVAPNGGVWCDGSEYTQAQFPDFYTMLVNGDIPSTTYENYTTELTANGVCGRFALDTANTKFRVPTLADAFFSSAVASNIGDYIGAKLAASTGTLTSGGIKYRPYVMLYVAAVEAGIAQAAEFINGLSLKEDKSNKVQDLTSPSETTYPSTQAIANESNRIINLMESKKYDIFPRTATDISGSRANWTAPSNGWLRFTYTSGNMATGEIYINSVLMVRTDWQNNWNSGNAYLTWPMKKGDKLTSSLPGYYTFWTTA